MQIFVALQKLEQEDPLARKMRLIKSDIRHSWERFLIDLSTAKIDQFQHNMRIFLCLKTKDAVTTKYNRQTSIFLCDVDTFGNCTEACPHGVVADYGIKDHEFVWSNQAPVHPKRIHDVTGC